ncbi:MAG: hypothetical protein OEX02_08750 [Cyclobacteriaceae bacterium]|nr:hypothetical protein [Cyclobacteriaceae bacterium]
MKTINSNPLFLSLEINKVRPLWWLIAGVVLMALSHLTWNVDLLAWVSVVPFLLYLNLTKGWKSRILFTIFLMIAWSLIVSKIISNPIPFFLIPLYSIPISILHLPAYLVYDKLKDTNWSVWAFPAMMITMEWIQYTFTPFASWGIAAYTQADSINMMQSVSLFGLAGLGFVIYWINTAVTHLILAKKPTFLNFHIPLLTVVVLAVFGHLRLDISKTTGKETIKVAAVGTDSMIGGLPLPSKESNIEVIQAIFKRTEKAAELGAKVIVWNEAAFFLLKEDELQWKDSIAQLANHNGIGIVASYVVPVSVSPLHYENKLVLFAPDGTVKYEYQKHEPVPGEPAVRGNEEIKATNLFNYQFGGAICYDYDFPYLARKNNKANVDIVALPSSDWRGIDPLHTKMAAFRAVEQGHSIIRSTRFGLSAAINTHGEMVSQMSSFDENDKILISNLPANKIRTIYSRVGDVFVYLNILLLLFCLFTVFPKPTDF